MLGWLRRDRVAVPLALGAVALWWLWWIGRSPLLFDEAYYWDWSRRPELGYVDHPPLVAWLIWVTTRMGTGVFSVRLGMVLCGVATVGLIWWAGRFLGGRAAGWRCLALATTCPLFGVLFGYAGPDAPLLLCWTGAVCALLRAVGTPRPARGWLWWCAAGGLCGLALSAKYVAVALPVSAALFVALSRQGGEPARWWRRPGPWPAALTALAVWSPNLWWNARHAWVAVRFQLDHGTCVAAARGADYAVQSWLYAQNQVTLLGPLLAALVAAGTLLALRAWWEDGDDAPLLLACCALVIWLAFFVLHGVRHWAAPAYVSGVLCAGVWGVPWAARMLGGPAGRRWVASAMTAVVCVAGAGESWTLQAAYSLRSGGGGGALVEAAAAVDAALVRPVPRWQEVAGLVDGVLARLPRRERGAAIVLADGYGTAAELAFTAPGRPRVYSGSNQYALWPPGRVRGPIVFVRDTVLVPELGALPAGGRLAASQVMRDGGAAVGTVTVVLYPADATGRVVRALLALGGSAPRSCR